ncbi:hypothetical protein M7I_1614 [Glarea lozoyensis 74030]|uniref:Uncharacterized protein n=1 Tax=Glarea lozoyensis (strain ATCC 74030 / MF5533) TaxID=1104152 RepID=H0EGJ8_GLAL7|nr:hypothetical protein M7I_1614 [Glarea lozoyensis 74030]
MEVSTTPIKWKVLGDKDIEERARKVKVAVIEYGNSYVKPTESHIDNTEDLQTFLESTAEPSYARLFVVEDLSRDVIEALGAKYDVDPQYFRSHIEDYLWNQETDAFTDLNGLPHQAKTRNYFNLRYMRARYFESEIVIREGKSELGHWNVLRSLEEDLSWKVRAIRKPKGPTVGLVRSKTALWIRKNKEEDHGILGILVVDPTLEAGYPLWEGPRNLLPCPSIHDTVIDQYGPHGTLFEDVCYYACNMSSEEMKAIEKDNRVLGLPIISLVTADWMRVIDYIITGLTRIEYRLEHPFARSSSSPTSASSHISNHDFRDS